MNTSAVPNTCVFCNSSDPLCVTCTSFTFCTSCSDNHYAPTLIFPSVQSCQLCNVSLLGCETCQDVTICLSCIDNHTFLHNTANQICVYCDQIIPNCALCTLDERCIGCSSTRFGITLQNTCQNCETFMRMCYYCTNRT